MTVCFVDASICAKKRERKRKRKRKTEDCTVVHQDNAANHQVRKYPLYRQNNNK